MTKEEYKEILRQQLELLTEQQKIESNSTHLINLSFRITSLATELISL